MNIKNQNYTYIYSKARKMPNNFSGNYFHGMPVKIDLDEI